MSVGRFNAPRDGYLNAVKKGRSIVVTVRGKPVARLTPISPPTKMTLPPEVEERMWKLAAERVLAWSGGPFRLPDPTAVNRGPKLLSDLIVEDRE